MRFTTPPTTAGWRSEEHTSELQSLRRISYAVFCLKKKNTHDGVFEHSFRSQSKGTEVLSLYPSLFQLLHEVIEMISEGFLFSYYTPTPQIYTYCLTLSLHDALPI